MSDGGKPWPDGELRGRAEEAARKMAGEVPEDVAGLPADEARRLVHELRVHQIELEMQNDELRRVQSEVEEARDKLRELYDFAPVGYATVDAKGLIVEANLTVCEMLGTTRASLVGKAFSHAVHPDDQDAFYHHRRTVLGELGRGTCGVRLVRSDGTEFHALLESVAAAGTDGTPTRWRTSVTDVSLQREAEERYRTLIDFLPAITYTATLDGAGAMLYVSPQVEDVLGVSPDDCVADPHTWARMLHPEDRDRVMAELAHCRASRAPLDCEYRMVRADGGEVWLHDIARVVEGPGHEPGSRLGVIHDITAHRRAEEEAKRLRSQLLQSQRLEAVGRLAGGVAHDFNNLLMGVGGLVGFACEEAEPGSQLHEDLTKVLALTDRAADLTSRLLAFSRRQTMEPLALNLNGLIADQTRMLVRMLEEDVELCFVPAPDLGNVRADPGQMAQIIISLAVNARDAMPGGGRLTIETANVELGQEYAAVDAEVVPGPYVMMAFADTGCGMEESVRARAFEPFFTTKEVGKGTGLGLSTVYGIVKQHDGSVRVWSEPGKGATFRVYLPRVAAKIEERPRPSGPVTGGSETILLVEDYDAVREITRRQIEALGYKALCAGNAREAREIAEDHGDGIDLLLTDVVMPDRNGRQLYEDLVALLPGLKVLFMSGYADDAVVHHGVSERSVAFIQKPFARRDLAAKIREVLGEAVDGG